MMNTPVSPAATGPSALPVPDTLRRSMVACERCRSRKTKCAGNPPHPCVACRGAGRQCNYSTTEKRITVPESYILELQAQARLYIQAAGEQHDQNRTTPADSRLTDEDWGQTGADNWVVNRSGQYHYMGNSSSTYIANRLNPTTETVAWHLYPHFDDTSWLRRPLNLYDVPELPPVDLIRRLYRAQHAYLGSIFSFVREGEFYSRLGAIYGRPPRPDSRDECLIWCQVLLVIAFGQMYSVNEWIGNNGPPGFVYFKHALKVLPDVHEDGSILFVEVLSYVAYYMQTLNRRDGAYLYIGLALRMAISLGLHQEVSDSAIDADAREHRRRVWWSVYSLERILSVTSGHPISIQDEDIAVQLPAPLQQQDESPRRAAVLASYTQLSRIQGIIGEQIYRMKQRSGTSLSAAVQDVMGRLGEWFEALPENVRLKPADLETAGGINRETVSTYLHYYHCINMTARPLLLYAVQRQMAAISQGQTGTRWEDGMPDAMVGVLDKAMVSARRSAYILNAAAKYNLIATYGFLDGEQAFSAALHLAMVNIAFPYSVENASALETALLVLQGMAERGNKYIRACHTLLTRITTTAVARNPATSAEGVPHQPLAIEHQVDVSPGCPQAPRPASAGFALNPDTDGLDPALWADVIGSMGIDMDRQWIETTFFGEDGLAGQAAPYMDMGFMGRP